MKRRLFVFDMDGTLLPGTTASLELARVTGTVEELRLLERRFAAGELDTKGFAAAIHALWGDVGPAVARRAFDAAPKLRNIRAVTEQIASWGGVSCVISMSPDYFVELFRDFGFDHIRASRFPRAGERLDFDAILTPEDKPRLAARICEAEGLPFEETVAFGDSMSDEPLFRALGTTIGINADERLSGRASLCYRGDDLSVAFAEVTKKLSRA